MTDTIDAIWQAYKEQLISAQEMRDLQAAIVDGRPVNAVAVEAARIRRLRAAVDIRRITAARQAGLVTGDEWECRWSVLAWRARG